MTQYQVSAKTEKKWVPIIRALYAAIYNEADKVSSLPGFEYVEDFGLQSFGRDQEARVFKVKRNSEHLLGIDMYPGDDGDILAVRDKESHASLLYLKLNSFLEDRGNVFRIWHDGRITGMASLTADDMLNYVKEKAPELFKIENDEEFIELGILKKGQYNFTQPDFRTFVSNLLLFSLLRKEIKNLYKEREAVNKFEKPSKVLLINITWNSSDWQEPTTDKSNHGYIKDGNIGHESWNFDFNNPRNTKDLIYGFAQFTKSPKVEGDNNLIVFSSKGKIVGFYGKAEILPKAIDVNKQESYNIIGRKDLSLVLKNKIDNIKQKGFLEEKKAIGRNGFIYLQKPSTALSILQQALKLNPEDSQKIEALIKWVKSGIINKPQQMANTAFPKSLIELNTILYGPPGTGKTYNTIIKAAQIVTGENMGYSDAKKIYESLLGDQIEFITFHQNYSYEDFVLGLRPDVKRDELKFTRHEGVFYRISKRAKDNYSAWKEGKEATEPAFERVMLEFLKPLQANGAVTVPLELAGKSISIASSSSNFLEYDEGGKRESLNIETLKDIYRNVISDKTEGKHVYYTAVVKQLRNLAEQLKKQTEKTELKNYVLIIDEINRANISRVFGELITLIEKDKRLGNIHEMKVTLTNGDQFSVPKNLYLIGTMNTADKSIALIDVALRRRFVFEPMYPQPQLVDSPYREFLVALNDQILQKKNADFLIGHSYLMPDDGEDLDFESALNHKIIPLLNEYFYNNRSVSVYSLLEPAIGHVPGFKIDSDPHTGVVCRRL